MFLLWTSFYYWFFKRNGTVLDVFYLDLMVSWLHLMFQVFKCLKWRVQPQSSVLPPKNRVWRCFIFFSELSSVHVLLFIMFLLFTGFNWRWVWHASFFNHQKTESDDALYIFLIFLLFIFFCSSFFFCLQSSTEEYKHIHLIFSFDLLFLLSINFFFLVSQPNWYDSLCFLLRSNGFLASSYVSGV